MARNRMIKPEFWEDDKIAECSTNARLLFVALWNFADDEGYIEYRPKWIKAKCFPYDSIKIEPLISELLKVKRLQQQGKILHIINFLKHQRIDRPKPSDLSQRYKDSTNDRRMIDERSTTKEKRREEKEREGEMSEQDFETFWANYPKKIDKQKCKEKFLKLNKLLLPTILTALEKQAKSDQWKEVRFIPHPTTWINGARWEDEVLATERSAEFYIKQMQTLGLIKFKMEYGKDLALEYHKHSSL